jgi:hypothetical protein
MRQGVFVSDLSAMRDYTSLESPPPPARPVDVPPYSKTVPVLFAALGLLMVFLVLAWLLFEPKTFGQKLIAFAVAGLLMAYLVNVFDGLQRRTVERMRLRLIMEGRLAVAQALAQEREQMLMKFLSTFVVKVHGAAGEMVSYGGTFTPIGPVTGREIDIDPDPAPGERSSDPWRSPAAR